ncbi:MAG TPA: hypothetical protein VMB21_06725 [Candidatus Limnocylindria bacterium]|jgi:hypothetical protein|nr:hypothetical protein [Candidatus Limnocylindria bacterium]
MELPLLGTPKPGLGAGDLFGAKLADPKGAKPVELAKSAGVESPPLLPPSGESSHTAIKELFAGLSPSPTAPAATPSPLAAPPMELGAEAAPTEPADSPAQAEAVGGIQAPHAAGEIHGTPGAQGGGTMKSGREQSEIAGWFTRGFLTRQNSTGDGRRVTAAISTSWRTKHSADGEFGDLSALNGSSPIASGAQAGLAADAMEVAAAPVSVAAHITEQAVHFKSSGLNSLQVVLKPDSNTEIHLKFVTRDGQTEAHAHVAMGDLQHLGSNWTQLQDSLAQQGIRLLPLSSDGSFAGGAGAQGDGAARPPLPEVPGTPLVAAKPVSPSSAASTAPEPTVHQLIKRLGLLDSWA